MAAALINKMRAAKGLPVQKNFRSSESSQFSSIPLKSSKNGNYAFSIPELDEEESNSNFAPINLSLISKKKRSLRSAPLSMKGSKKINFMNFEPQKCDCKF